MINPEIFRANDIRGLIPSELNKKTAYLIGQAIAEVFSPSRVLVSRDHRKSGKYIKSSLTKALRLNNIDVIDIGVNPTPVFYYAMLKSRLKLGLQITASHNPKEYNGIKLQQDNALSIGWDSGIEKLRNKVISYPSDVSIISAKKPGQGTYKRKSYRNAYIKKLRSLFNPRRKLKVIVDTGNGVVGTLAERIMQHKANVTTIFAEPDDNFPNHIADPHKTETLRELQRQVIFKKADLGIAFDGDGDRVGMVDNKGRVVDPDKLIMLLTRRVLGIKKGTIVYSPNISMAAIEDATAHGGKVVISKTGHSYVSYKITESNAIFGAELSGHFYHPLDYYQYDDGIFSALKLCEITSSVSDISKVIDLLPAYYKSPEINIKVDDTIKFELIEQLKKITARSYKTDFTDGIKLFIEGGWALIRASNTGPYIRCIVEGKTKKSYQRIISIVKKTLKEVNLKINF